jgi:hypothetical protein
VTRPNIPRRNRGYPPEAVETQNRLHDALKLLFDLLEEYGPVWYKKHHHDEAESALSLPLGHTHILNKSHVAPKRPRRRSITWSNIPLTLKWSKKKANRRRKVAISLP